jgi:hypothetical protein
MHDFHVVLATPVTRQSSLASVVAPGMEQPAEADYLASSQPETEEEKRDRILAAYDGARRALTRAEAGTFDSAGLRRRRDVMHALDAVVLHEADPSAGGLDDLRVGLATLVRRWDLQDDHEREITGHLEGKPSWSHDERIIEIVYK